MTTPQTREPSAPVAALDPVDQIDPDDPRAHVEVGVLLANGRLAGRKFASRAEAEAWAQGDEQVVEFTPVCECEM